MSFRKITSLTSLLSFIVLIINSVVLYIAPQGRIAYWADWRLWGLTKDQWGDQHIIIGLLFLIAIFLHIYLNWKPIVSYLKNKAKQLKLFTKDFNIALMITILFTIGAYFATPPLNWVVEFGASLKDAAAVKYGEPPYGHAELSSVKTFIVKAELDPAQSLENLKKSGIRFESDTQKIYEIARINRISPQQVYLAMKPAEEPDRTKTLPDTAPASDGKKLQETGAPTGLGKLTIEKVCETYNLPPAEALKKLSAKGIQASPEDKIKALADKYKMAPIDLFEIMK